MLGFGVALADWGVLLPSCASAARGTERPVLEHIIRPALI